MVTELRQQILDRRKLIVLQRKQRGRDAISRKLKSKRLSLPTVKFNPIVGIGKDLKKRATQEILKTDKVQKVIKFIDKGKFKDTKKAKTNKPKNTKGSKKK